MRQQITIYLSEDLLQFYRREAAKQGRSLSSCVVRYLSTLPNQISELQQWLADRFDKLDAANGAVMDKALQVLAVRSGDGLLAQAGLQHLPPELLLTALTMMGRELADLSQEAREQMAARGRELLAKTNGASK